MSKSNFPNFPSSSNYRPLYLKTDFPQFSSGFLNMKGGDVSDDTAFLDTTIGEYINKNITEFFSKEKKYRIIPPQHLKTVKNYMVIICKNIIELRDDDKRQQAYIQKKYLAHSPKKAYKLIKDIKDKKKLEALKAFIIPIMANFMKHIKKDFNKKKPRFNKKKPRIDALAADDEFDFDITKADFLDDELLAGTDDPDFVTPTVRQSPSSGSTPPPPQYSMLPNPVLRIPTTKPKGQRLKKPLPPPAPRPAALPAACHRLPVPPQETHDVKLTKEQLHNILTGIAVQKPIHITDGFPTESQLTYLKGMIINIMKASFTEDGEFNYNNYIENIQEGRLAYENKLKRLPYNTADPKRLLYSILLDFLCTVEGLKLNDIKNINKSTNKNLVTTSVGGHKRKMRRKSRRRKRRKTRRKSKKRKKRKIKTKRRKRRR